MFDTITTYKDVLRTELRNSMERDKRIVVLGDTILDASHESLQSEAQSLHPDRFVELPLSEDIIGDIAIGMALNGLRPIVNFDYCTFIAIAYDSIFRASVWNNRNGKQSPLPILFRVGHYGYMGRGPELSTSMLAQLYHIPSLIIMTPSSAYHAKGLFMKALTLNEPVVFIEHKALYNSVCEVPKHDYDISLGAVTLVQGGTDCTIVSLMYTGLLAADAGKRLQEHKLSAEVLLLETLNPLSIDELISSAQKTKRVVLVEEDMIQGGIMAEIGAQIMCAVPGVKLVRIGAKNIPLPGNGRLEKQFLPSINSIVKECLSLCSS